MDEQNLLKGVNSSHFDLNISEHFRHLDNDGNVCTAELDNLIILSTYWNSDRDRDNFNLKQTLVLSHRRAFSLTEY